MSKHTLVSASYPALSGSHGGTGLVSGQAHVADPATVGAGLGGPMKFLFTSYSVHIISAIIEAPVAPNWFGIAFRKGISRFDTVNIFFHPFPQGAGMEDKDYPSRSGAWSKLFRYAQNLGLQMAIARSNHVTLVPFFSNASYGSAGIFKSDWLDICDQALALARKAAAGASTIATSSGARTAEFIGARADDHIRHKAGTPAPKAPPAHSGSLQSIVLSCFSRGMAPMTSFRSSAPGLASFHRESWDFDGVGGTRGGPRYIRYDQSKFDQKIPLTFHVPPSRWVEYHSRVIADVHGDIPNKMATHAATISVVGK
jgi:hypothetical protein